MISFIIIGRKEGWKLTNCLQSVFETIAYNKLKNAEVIYVDSKSTDDSIERAKAFDKVKVLLITGECNAAIARNIGAKEANGDILFFIDGDMEIEKEFLSHATINNQLKYDCLTGHLDDYLYDINDTFLGVKTRTYKNKIPDNNQIIKTNGGLFLIKKEAWNDVGGMKTKYRRSQDIDLTMRLAEKGIKTFRLPALIAKHHTIEYNNEKRMWNDLKKLNSLYPGLLFRDHLLNTVAWSRVLRSNYTAVLFLMLIISLIINNNLVILFSAILYFMFFSARVAKNTLDASISKNKILYFLDRIVFQFLRDLLFWFGFFFFHPKPKKIKYTTVN
jgi:glycosyltransferase involved in cell wall biosynthesis